MTFSNFEKYAAGKINSYASEVDAEALLNDILPHVQKDNNRKRGLIWFFFAGLIIALAAFYTMSDGNHPDSGNEITALSSANIISKERTNESKQSTDNKLVVEDGSQTEIDEKIETSTKKLNTKTTKTTKSSKISNSANNAVKNNKANNQDQVTPNNSKTVDAEETPIGLTEDEASEKVTPPIALSEDNNKNEATPTEDEQIIAEPDVIVDSMSFGEENQIKNEIAANESEESEEEELPRSRFKLKYGVGLYGGFSSSFASLKDRSTLNEEYLQLRLQTEEQLETIQMGLDFMVKSEIGVYARTGIQYSRIARKFSLNSEIVTVDTVEGVQKIYVNPNTGDSTFVYGPVPVTTTTTYNKITYNYFHLMDIPVVVGYNYSGDDSNWSFGAEAGALINLSMKTKGEIMAPNGTEIYDMKEDPDKWFKDNIGVSFIASIMIAYNLDDNFQIYLSPTARLESIFSTDANPIEQKHGSLGINLGARYFIGY